MDEARDTQIKMQEGVKGIVLLKKKVNKMLGNGNYRICFDNAR